MPQILLESVSPRHGRILIYVWAIEQDAHSKRVIPVSGTAPRTCADADAEGEWNTSGQDVFVPWVLSSGCTRPEVLCTEEAQNAPKTKPDAIQRYYHMFAKGELDQLVQTAAQEMRLKVGTRPTNEAEECEGTEGIEVVASGWERSNYYVELRRWRK
jgi:tRNA (uracil-5-)-methyltransferase TRM9